MSRHLLHIAIFISLAACGGGGGNGGLGQGGGGNNNTNYQPGVFLDWSTFLGRCQAPRPGTNDIQGSTLDENNFLRSYSNDTYLWYDEIPDQDPGLFNDPLVYFDTLRTSELTPSGNPKDRFHFTFDTEEWEQLSQGGVSAGYGAQWAILAASPPREILVAYTEPNSPATSQGLVRGTEIVAIDGVDVENGSDVDSLNAGLFPSAPGEQHTFTVLDPGAQQTRNVILTAQSITTAPVQNTQVISTPTGEVGYMTFNDHVATAEQALINAVNTLNAHNNGAGVDDLVLDIRYNGGGFLAIAAELAYMVAGPGPTGGQVFDNLMFNDKHPATNPVTGAALSPTPFYDRTLGPPFNGNNGNAGQPLPTLNLSRVYVLTGPGTCSASEAVMNGLRGVGVEVIQVGSTTCGKPYGFFPTDNCGTTYFTIQFRGANALGFGDYADGFSPANATDPGEVVPGCSVADDFTRQLGDPTEGRLAVALSFRDGQGCPAPSGVAAQQLNAGMPVTDRGAVDAWVPKSPWHTNLILRPQ